ncbi:ribosome-associated translation inhibitor RaiA [Sesbania bispinosa]|nr:ribosome-associated translation inhibitor RaiA [Sesbania bispinosa]
MKAPQAELAAKRRRQTAGEHDCASVFEELLGAELTSPTVVASNAIVLTMD